MKRSDFLRVFGLSLVSLYSIAKGNMKDKEVLTKTIENIKKIIKSELKSFKFYTATGEKAKKEGYPEIAKQFFEIGEDENSHYEEFKDLLKKINVDFKEEKPDFILLSTKDNVNTSIHLEEVAIRIYERSIKQAQIDKYKEAEDLYKWAMEMERKHIAIFQKFKDNFDSYKK